jgi:hypothetical protein
LEDLETLLALPDEQLLERLGAEVWQEGQHAFPATPKRLREEATAWLSRNRTKIRTAVCGHPGVRAVQQNADSVVLVGAILDVLAVMGGIPAPSVVAILIARIGLNRLCGASAAPAEV